MRTTPDDRKYAKTHEWVKLDGGVATVGISDHAQKALGDITFVELPAAGARFDSADAFGVIESVKAASDLFVPVGGEIAEVNQELADKPELVNDSPYEKGWMVKLKDVDASRLGGLMNAAEYDAAVSAEA